jgi:transcriptional regulator
MYIPKHFYITDLDKIIPIIENYPLALVTFINKKNEIEVNTLPFVIRSTQNGKMTLATHYSKANPLQFCDSTLTIIFSGPHSYISPTAYGDHSDDEVPTWNYVTIEVSGLPQLITDEL